MVNPGARAQSAIIVNITPTLLIGVGRVTCRRSYPACTLSDEATQVCSSLIQYLAWLIGTSHLADAFRWLLLLMTGNREPICAIRIRSKQVARLAQSIRPHPTRLRVSHV